jgi:ribonucleoside-diphosphate reductase alpha chain
METIEIFDKIKKRNGTVVAFDRSRIERAMEKACVAQGFGGAIHRLPVITDAVIADLRQHFAANTPSVEDVQDAVERKLAENGLWEVAKSYILYRKEREKARENEKVETLQKIEARTLNIRRADGTTVPFEPLKIEEAFSMALPRRRSIKRLS